MLRISKKQLKESYKKGISFFNQYQSKPKELDEIIALVRSSIK